MPPFALLAIIAAAAVVFGGSGSSPSTTGAQAPELDADGRATSGPYKGFTPSEVAAIQARKQAETADYLASKRAKDDATREADHAAAIKRTVDALREASTVLTSHRE